jgi:hypothetical protein
MWSTKPFARIHLPVSPQAKTHNHNFEKLSVETAVARCQVVLQWGKAAADNDAACKKCEVSSKEDARWDALEANVLPWAHLPLRPSACDSGKRNVCHDRQTSMLIEQANRVALAASSLVERALDSDEC